MSERNGDRWNGEGVQPVGIGCAIFCFIGGAIFLFIAFIGFAVNLKALIKEPVTALISLVIYATVSLVGIILVGTAIAPESMGWAARLGRVKGKRSSKVARPDQVKQPTDP